MTTEATEAAANEQAFSAGYSKEVSSAQVQHGTAAPAAPAPAAAEPAEKAQPAAAEPAKPAEPVKDEWEGVPKVVRTHLETISNRLGKVDKLEQDLKTTAGRVAAMQSAATAVRKDGGQAPSQQQIQEASGSLEKWKTLLESFPDFKEGLEERFGAIDAALKQHKPFDQEGFTGAIHTLVTNSTRELREFAKLDSKHDGWEDTINTPQFAEWAFAQGPTAVEQAQWRMLKAQSPDKAEEFFKTFEERYPQWWQDRGALMASSVAKDAIALLDGYQAHTKAVSAKQQQQDKSKQRLEAAIQPRGAGAPPGQPAEDEEAAFASGYKKAYGK